MPTRPSSRNHAHWRRTQQLLTHHRPDKLLLCSNVTSTAASLPQYLLPHSGPVDDHAQRSVAAPAPTREQLQLPSRWNQHARPQQARPSPRCSFMHDSHACQQTNHLRHVPSSSRQLPCNSQAPTALTPIQLRHRANSLALGSSRPGPRQVSSSTNPDQLAAPTSHLASNSGPSTHGRSFIQWASSCPADNPQLPTSPV